MLEKTYYKKLKAVMEHNEYAPQEITVEECTKVNRWTPTDLILREYLNNGGGSAKGFLGLTRKECFDCVEYIEAHLEELIARDMINEVGKNNWGFTLRTNYYRGR